ncbi:MAG: hypothetical protein JWN48_22 [Myxococcaceae bacterium]|nr:hypothetical protein [Myxococcaceae bacterium]
MKRILLLSLVLSIAQGAWTQSADAQLRPRTARLWLDTDLVSAGTVRIDPAGGGNNDSRTTAVGIGPNQLGGSRPVVTTTPLGIGVAYVLEPKWMVGLRYGFGYDWYNPEQGPNQRVLAVSAIPELSYVPTGDDDSKVFIKAGPLVQYNRIKSGADDQHVILGGFSAGLGLLQFVTRSSSIDLGAFFEGRFGSLKRDLDANDNGKDKVRDLRGVIRIGVSLWRGREHSDHEHSDREHADHERRDGYGAQPQLAAPPSSTLPLEPPPRVPGAPMEPAPSSVPVVPSSSAPPLTPSYPPQPPPSSLAPAAPPGSPLPATTPAPSTPSPTMPAR